MLKEKLDRLNEALNDLREEMIKDEHPLSSMFVFVSIPTGDENDPEGSIHSLASVTGYSDTIATHIASESFKNESVSEIILMTMEKMLSKK